MPEHENGASIARPRPGGDAPSRRSEKKKRPASPRRSAPPRGRWGHTYAAIDLGTNNCRLLVAKPTRAGFRVVDAFSRTVRLGEGVESSGVLAADSMDRAMTALKICAEKIKHKGATRVRAIATEACRMASNGADFVASVKQQTGLELDIVPTSEEARLAATGCASLLDYTYDGALIFDIGGGSTELVWMDLKRSPGGPDGNADVSSIAGWTSLPCGVVNLAERCGSARHEKSGYEAMVAEVIGHLEQFDGDHLLRDAFDAGRVHLLGTSGTVTTLAGVHLGLARYDRSKVDGAWIDNRDIKKITRRLSAMTIEQRAKEPCVGRDRADLIIAGCAIYEAIQRKWPCERLRVADRGLREGILFALMEEADEEQAPPKRRSRRRRRRRKNRASKPAANAVAKN